jgi:hypothetical protein
MRSVTNTLVFGLISRMFMRAPVRRSGYQPLPGPRTVQPA